jgi:hypothetical protein
MAMNCDKKMFYVLRYLTKVFLKILLRPLHRRQKVYVDVLQDIYLHQLAKAENSPFPNFSLRAEIVTTF